MVEQPHDKVRELEYRWRDALIEHDEEALRHLIHPQFKLVGIRSTGSISFGLEDWITALRKMDIASLEVRVKETVACDKTLVATVDAQWRVRYLGQCIDERVLLTDVWVEGDEGWQVIRRHSSPVPSGCDI